MSNEKQNLYCINEIKQNSFCIDSATNEILIKLSEDFTWEKADCLVWSLTNNTLVRFSHPFEKRILYPINVDNLEETMRASKIVASPAAPAALAG